MDNKQRLKEAYECLNLIADTKGITRCSLIVKASQNIKEVYESIKEVDDYVGGTE